jgi:tRNA uridine 5-carboxymethylaminomethyl modification enzyme
MAINEFDCIVIGAGHAGIEAAHAAAIMGAKTLLLTISKDTIAKMSCNPAIGGLAKGQIAREVDALGGLMGEAIDATGIQFRMLNCSKGPAVQSPRAQADKYKYQDFMRARLENTPNLMIAENVAAEILVAPCESRATSNESRLCGVRCKDGTVYNALTVIITAGTFLRGLMHIGTEQMAGGRLGEPASVELSQSLERIGLQLGRLKTGTPVRLDGATVDYDKCETQSGDATPRPFSFLTDSIERPQIPCWMTYTNEAIHKLLRDNLDRAPLYSGQITAVGPRYCPSIENKIVRFADKARHQIFLEPEDEKVSTIYCNGLSTSFPKDIQQQMLRLMPGTENARIVHYAYAIEYDYCPPIQLQASLETKRISGLFMAGQVNGTSGYEEAAAQGIIAGINAVRKLQAKGPLVLRRDQAYIGVLIDDLLTKGIDEPYRMFTSRAEYRLSLRSDNADRRLTQIGREVGLVSDARWLRFEKKLADLAMLENYLKTTRTGGLSLWQHLKQPKNTDSRNSWLVPRILQQATSDERRATSFSDEVIEAAVIEAKYEGYLVRQAQLVEKFSALENKKIPQELDYSSVPHLRAEAREKLSAVRPYTLGQAGRISGITPADILVIQIHLKKTK